MEGPAYFLIGCPVIRRVRAGTDCHRLGFGTDLSDIPLFRTYRLSYHCLIIHRCLVLYPGRPSQSGRRRFLRHRHEIPRCLPGPHGRGGASGRLHPDRCRFHFFRNGGSGQCLSGPSPLSRLPRPRRSHPDDDRQPARYQGGLNRLRLADVLLLGCHGDHLNRRLLSNLERHPHGSYRRCRNGSPIKSGRLDAHRPAGLCQRL